MNNCCAWSAWSMATMGDTELDASTRSPVARKRSSVLTQYTCSSSSSTPLLRPQTSLILPAFQNPFVFAHDLNG